MCLERIDDERAHMENITQKRLPNLGRALDKFRACVLFQLQECLSPQASPQRPQIQTARSAVPPMLNLTAAQKMQEKSLSPLPSPQSGSSGIGTWIANVVNQAVEDPSVPPPSLALTDPRISAAFTSSSDEAPSVGTFLSENYGTFGIQTASFGVMISPNLCNLEKVDSPMLLQVPKLPNKKKRHGMHAIASTIVSADDWSIYHHELTDDKIAIAKETRRGLTRDQRMALDWILKDISKSTTAAELEQILWEGANPNTSHVQFGTILIRAAHTFTTPILRLLVEYGADMTQTSHTVYHSAVHAAVLGGQLCNLQWLAEAGMCMNAPNQQGETPLHLAVRTPGGYPIAKWLLEAGADVNRKAMNGTTPFQMALSPSKVDSRERSMLIELLLAQGAEGERDKGIMQNRGKGLSVLGLI